MATEKLSMGIEIDKALIEKNVSDAVCIAIAAALGDKTELVRKAVRAVVASSVDERGEPCASSSYRAQPYLRWLATNAIKDTVSKKITTMIDNNQAAFSATIRAERNQPAVQDMLAKNFITAILNASQTGWRMPVTVSFEQIKED
jgi:hypothetical protein